MWVKKPSAKIDTVFYLQEWFTLYHRDIENYTPDPRHIKESLNKESLDPYSSRVIMLYKEDKDDDRMIQIVGYMRYDEDLEVVTQTPPKFNLNRNDDNEYRYQEEREEQQSTSITNLMKLVDQILDEKEEKEEFPNFDVCELLLFTSFYYPRFYQLLYPWLIRQYQFHSETACLKWLSDKNFLKEFIIDATLEDRQEYFKEYPLDQVCPSIWYNIHFSHLPSEIADRKLWYEGGFCHLNYKEMGGYVWRICSQQLQKKCPDSPPEQLKVVLEYIHSRLKGKQKGESGIGDIEDMAPCMKNIAFGKKFPLDQNRLHFTRVMARGNVPLQDVKDILSNLNEKDPHRFGHINLEKRFDPEYAYNRKYAPPYCEQIQTCPFKGSLDQKKLQCHQQVFKKKFPQDYHPAQAQYFYGPADWHKWRNKNKKKFA